MEAIEALHAGWTAEEAEEEEQRKQVEDGIKTGFRKDSKSGLIIKDTVSHLVCHLMDLYIYQVIRHQNTTPTKKK